ncbi:esterase-like activity of phytase family protein [Cryptosporangium phraense]|uniref:Esterase-like activity of phytase family protein n=1 Tax=Cryptosporangium phraense TaxID=2593070 RepID=A0A545B0N4_9ACTN|nr:esterase-like activity of phytase family protein [Cryptosporangium phraense]
MRAGLAAALALAGLLATAACRSDADRADPDDRAPSAAPSTPAAARLELEYLGSTTIPRSSDFQGTAVGGLSGISFDREHDRYYVISDDRSERSPARFYTAAITIGPTGSVRARLTGTKPLLRRDGSVYPPLSYGYAPPDPEGIAVDPRSGNLYWVDEGERSDVLANPAVRVATPGGARVRELPIPKSLRIAPGRGPRRNQALEGVTFTPDGRQLYVAMEDPLLQDGPNPTARAGALTRVTRYTGDAPDAQYAYPLEPLFLAPREADRSATNGLSDLVALGGGRFLTIERAAVPDRFRIKVRIYLADANGATNVLSRSLGGAVPMRKTLLLDLDDTRGHVDNVEGVTLGPDLPDGRKSVVLVTDDNFNWIQQTQVIALALSGA